MAPLEDFIARFSRRTRKSKEQRRAHGRVLADSRASAGYRRSFNEIVYPIVGLRGKGCRLWDIDGNEYIDLTMGFGVQLFGHNPAFVSETLGEFTTSGFLLGPQADLAGDVAERICRLTGAQRVCFCNSGTEAVMTAIRLARAATGRQRIAMFWGSYHGNFDATLARPRGPIQAARSVPGAPGIAAGAVADTLVLRYGDPESLRVLDEHAADLAAVLVEPVQARNLPLQPGRFLQDLRKWTSDHGIALIFDEVLLGFRIHPGGAQAWFDVKADLVTYGKVIGGGMAIGVTAGDARFMNAIDGGFLDFGDFESVRTPTTFFAGTFNKHPLTMALSQQVLMNLEAGGPALQSSLNERCARLVKALNLCMAKNDIAITVDSFASIFRFTFKSKLDIFFYYLIQHGLYVWEGRTCFVSLAHSDDDLEEVVEIVRKSVAAMRSDRLL